MRARTNNKKVTSEDTTTYELRHSIKCDHYDDDYDDVSDHNESLR
jgi:hypothetical protein